jgi:hypothetical protein
MLDCPPNKKTLVAAETEAGEKAIARDAEKTIAMTLATRSPALVASESRFMVSILVEL